MALSSAATPGERVRRRLGSLVLLAVTVVFFFPYLWMLASSLKPTADVFKYGFPLSWKTFLPPHPTLENYATIFSEFGFGRNLLNSLIVVVCQVVLTLVVCAGAGFVFGRFRFRGSRVLFGLVMVASFIPFEVVMVPMYVVTRELRLTDTYAGLFLPWVANAIGIFLIRQSVQEVPRSLDEAAAIDGASTWRTFVQIILPNLRPALLTVGLISAVAGWNQFLWPLIAVQDPDKQVVQVAIATFTDPGQLPTWGELFAAASVAALPLLIIFLFLQRYYIRGVVTSGMKG
ncbi:carbohydrate ABC transporter permease [Kribbella shirazensis]|uniref:ABC-type glycerol-3-phosphate transport system permease component n=1 Tax=Kribbella shirazensis TaxID=1105143 RepID=A0A7X5VCG8_9ACTN|nr:carbohydrate ABC transporter permease [Kribbella shirazensis]NIK58602.1 ABC-type glycerol-3-phosphate transport system permease component [Kribbella shirazensis]